MIVTAKCDVCGREAQVDLDDMRMFSERAEKNLEECRSYVCGPDEEIVAHGTCPQCLAAKRRVN
jgi:hypothetical protein